jgi:KUP system potassium uptake protein
MLLAWRWSPWVALPLIRVLIVTVVPEEIPFVPVERRVALRPLGKGVFRVIIRYGFMDVPDVPAALELCRSPDFEFDAAHVSYFVSRETIVPSLQPGIALWRERIFALMSRMAQSATDFFKIPTENVVELGTQVEI